ncbi:MAG: hypothetical protein IJH64_01930 [Oscillospiraceae bacterium]|nr:hypothetical protein [Oscillospiraceae bacterium]
MNETIIKGLFDLACIIVSALLGYMISQLTKAKQVDASIQSGVRILLYDRIKHLGKKYVQNGWVSLEDLEDLHNMHNIYHNDLQGNGFLDSLMNSVNQLPNREN